MDNNEIDKDLKEKLKNKITVPEEVEKKIVQKVEEEKNSRKANEFKPANANEDSRQEKIRFKLTKFISVAAMVVVIFTVGIFFNGQNNELLQNSEEDIVVTIQAIEPTKLESSTIANDSEFIIIIEEENASVESVQKSLYIEPALEYTIEKTSNSNEYKLTFKQNIPDNTILKLQYVKNQVTENSWAYQTSNKLSVTETFPTNGSNDVSKKSVIEIELSYASVENLQEYVEISPEVEGTWEHNGKVWRFTPETELDEEQTYTVKIKSGLEAEDQVMEEDYIFQFGTYEDASDLIYYAELSSIDGIYTCKSDEIPYIYYSGDEDYISEVEILEFASVDDFINYVEDNDYNNAESIGKYEYEKSQIDVDYYERNYLKLKETLTSGYYVAVVKSSQGKELFNYPIQVNDLSAYVIETERDVLAWVADGDGNLASGVKVEYLSNTQTTNDQGIATFEDINDSSEKIKYAKIGNSENPLVVGVYNYSLDNYPSGYIYTDRPLYQNTDTINIWGFVPLSLFYDEVEDEFYIELDNEGKQKIDVGEDGNINYTIDLTNHVDNEYSEVKLYYKDEIIATRSIQIQHYELQNYTYEAVIDRNYAYTGETYEFGVKVTSITGLTVQSKDVVIEYDGTEYKEKTDEQGIAHFSIKIEDDIENAETSGVRYKSISIYNGDAEEYTDADIYFEFYVLSRNVYTEIEEDEEIDNKFTITLYKLIEDEDISIESIEDLYESTYDTEVSIFLSESKTVRTITGYEYDEYTKENEPIYSYSTETTNEIIDEITTNNGKFEYDANTLNFKEDTDDVWYSYELIFEYLDENNKQVSDEQGIYQNGYNEEAAGVGYYYTGEYDVDGEYSYDEIYSISAGADFDEYYYYTYRYLLQKDWNSSDKFSIGDSVSFTLAESKDGGVTEEIENSGKLLTIVFQEDITQTSITEDSNYSYTFTDDDFPSCKITSAYFLNGKFYRMPTYAFDFDEEDKTVDIEISADKEQYEPGDEVTLTIKTTCNGNAIESFVNISVVNEAVFALDQSIYGNEDTSLVSTIYQSKVYPVYTYSSYADYLANGEDGGGGAGDDEIRSDFADTACFETVYTDKNGIATLTFTLPDNVTTYRVTAQSANEDLYLGETSIDITSALDFYVQVTEPRNVKTTDDLVLSATSIAEDLYDVEYEFTITELDKTLTATETTNSITSVNFGKLEAGTYHAVIRGFYGEQIDAVEFEFTIVESTQEIKNKTTVNIKEDTEITPTKNPIVLEIYNENMEQYIEYIDFIESTVTSRLDTRIAYNEIQNIKNKYYGTTSTINSINMTNYYGERTLLRNLKNSEEDLVLTALVNYYTQGYCDEVYISLDEDDNLFEYYLYLASDGESVLTDLLYLKEETDIDNYNKLLVTLSLEFVGDYQNAKELYNTIDLSDDEIEEYGSLIAIIDTFINKDNAIAEINNLIENDPSDEYLRFAILSFFENNSIEIGEEKSVTISYGETSETVTLNGMEIKTYTISDKDLNTISFETDSDSLLVSYYYQTSLEEVESDNIKKDISIELEGNIEKGNTVNLIISFADCSDIEEEGEVRVALPNSFRLARSYEYFYYNTSGYYLLNNNIDYVTFYKGEDCSEISIPLLVSLEGNYEFENVVYSCNGIYHISDTLNFDAE